MDNNPETKQTEQHSAQTEGTENQKGQTKMWHVVAISVFVAALIVGSGVFLWQKMEIKKMEDENGKKIESLQAKISELQEKQETKNTEALSEDPQIDEDDSEDSGVDSSWTMYKNEHHDYTIKHPQYAKIEEIGVGAQSRDDACVKVDFDYGAIYIAPTAEGGPCGFTGGDWRKDEKRSENIVIGGKEYTANGAVFHMDENDEVDFESMALNLEDGTRIQYNSSDLREKGIIHEKYLEMKKDMIKSLESFNKN